MAACSRLANLKRLLPRISSNIQINKLSQRGFQTSRTMTEEQVEELKKNPYFDKYADKITKLQKTSPEEFLGRLSAHEEMKKAPAPEQKDFSLPGRARSPVSVNPATKTLEKIMKLDLLKDKTAEEITEIWTKHFTAKDAICAVIPAETYKTMQKRFQQYNTFLFPVPRKNGYEFVMAQFQGDEAHFTTLINFQAHKENAPECLSLVHYTELVEDKGIVLMVGEYDKDSLGEGEANLLAVLTLQYYGGNNEKKLNHLLRFSVDLDDFNHLDLIAELEVDFPAPA